ncbi:MAG: NTP transferase domain-containing protein [Candidatus Riflebacteria bacterium]|nr:NTP transferase domain-containing protein [Candidatus Riflebacteria bacterium]
MKAMVLCAGLGTRLGTLGKTMPKCLLRAGGRTLLEHVAVRLASAGVTTLVLNLHHCAGAIRAHVIDRGGFGLEVLFSEEEALLDTGGGVRRAGPLLAGGDVIVHNCDVVTDLALEPLLEFHRRHRAVATLATLPTDDTRVLLFDDAGALSGWRNRASGEERLVPGSREHRPRGFGCIQVLSQRFLAGLAQRPERFSMVHAWLDAACAGERILSYPGDGAFWIDVGTPEKLDQLRARVGP